MASKEQTPVWYFINTVLPGELADPTLELEIQVLNPAGQAIATAYCARSTDTVRADSFVVPIAVLNAARRLVAGLGGEYVDSEGSLLSFDGCVRERPPTPSSEEAASRILESALKLLERKMPGWKLRLELLRSRYKGTSSEAKASQLLEEHGGA